MLFGEELNDDLFVLLSDDLKFEFCMMWSLGACLLMLVRFLSQLLTCAIYIFQFEERSW